MNNSFTLPPMPKTRWGEPYRPQKKAKKSSFSEGVKKGAVAGIIDASVANPFLVWGLSRQFREPLPKNFMGYFQGWRFNSLTMMTTFTAMFVVKELGPEQTRVQNLFAASFAATCCMNPFETAKVQQNLDRTRKMDEVVKALWTKFGPRGFFLGFQAALLRNFLYFSSIECAHAWGKRVEQKDGKADMTLQVITALSFGTLASVISQPAHVLSNMLKKGNGNASLAHGFREVWQKGGLRGFYVAGLPRTFRVTLSALALVITTNSLEKRNNP